MRIGSTAEVLAKCMLKYYKISARSMSPLPSIISMLCVQADDAKARAGKQVLDVSHGPTLSDAGDLCIAEACNWGVVHVPSVIMRPLWDSIPQMPRADEVRAEESVRPALPG